jgi:hypothetical protein
MAVSEKNRNSNIGVTVTSFVIILTAVIVGVLYRKQILEIVRKGEPSIAPGTLTSSPGDPTSAPTKAPTQLAPKNATLPDEVIGISHNLIISSDIQQSELKPYQITGPLRSRNIYQLTHDNASFLTVHFEHFNFTRECELEIIDPTNGEILGRSIDRSLRKTMNQHFLQSLLFFYSCRDIHGLRRQQW